MHLRRSSNGFTLIETLCGLVIISILGLVMAQALHTMMKNQFLISKKISQLTQLQSAMVLITRDFNQIQSSIIDSQDPTSIKLSLTKNKEVQYWFHNHALYRSSTYTQRILDKVDQIKFEIVGKRPEAIYIHLKLHQLGNLNRLILIPRYEKNKISS